MTEPTQGTTGADLELVLTTGAQIAQDQLAEHGAVLPFAVVLETPEAVAARVAEGDPEAAPGEPNLRLVVVEPEQVSSATDSGDNPDEEPAVDIAATFASLGDALQAQAEDALAVAFVSDVALAESGQDAILLDAVHREGETSAVLIPYRFSGDDLVLDEPVEAQSEAVVWG